MEENIVPELISGLDEDDIVFVKKFILNSSSLKEVAEEYGVTYQEVRLRLDRLMLKMNEKQEERDDSYTKLIKRLASNNKIDVETAKMLVTEYKRVKKTWKK